MLHILVLHIQVDHILVGQLEEALMDLRLQGNYKRFLLDQSNELILQLKQCDAHHDGRGVLHSDGDFHSSMNSKEGKIKPKR